MHKAGTHAHTQKHATHLSFVFKYFIQKKPKAHLQNFKPSVSMFLEWRTVPSPHRDRCYGSNNSPTSGWSLGGADISPMHKKDKFQTAGQVEKILSTYFFFYAHTSGK